MGLNDGILVVVSVLEGKFDHNYFPLCRLVRVNKQEDMLIATHSRLVEQFSLNFQVDIPFLLTLLFYADTFFQVCVDKH